MQGRPRNGKSELTQFGAARSGRATLFFLPEIGEGFFVLNGDSVDVAGQLRFRPRRHSNIKNGTIRYCHKLNKGDGFRQRLALAKIDC